jgi:CheY-like chemotaxis protein
MQAYGKDVEREDRDDAGREYDVDAMCDIRGARILLVEDNEINQEVAREILETAGLMVEIANNGKEAVQMIRHKDKELSFDAVLMDVQMPVMDGHTATREIRKWEKEMHKRDGLSVEVKPVPIIAMTAHAMTGDRDKSLEAGMNDHVTKPVDPDELFSALVKWIKPREHDVQAADTRVLQGIVEGTREKDAEAEILPPALPGISIKSGLAKVGGNKKLFRKLLCSFLESNKEVVGETRKALQDKDMETAARLAHTVKGVSGNLGAEDLFSAAEDLEKAIKQRDTDSLDSLLGDFESQLNVVMGGIQSLEENEAEEEALPDGEVQIDVDKVAPLVVDMMSLLETDITEAMNRLEDLRKYLEDSAVRNEFKKLENHVEKFDTDSAMKSLKTIAQALNVSSGER